MSPLSTTIQSLLTESIALFKKASIPSAELDAELLLAYILKKDRSYLMAHSEMIVPKSVQAEYRAWCTRRAERLPLAYIMGYKEFYGLTFKVTPSTLIPRPETEELVDTVRAWLKDHPHATSLIDVGVGSGAIPCAIATHEPQLTTVIGVDVSPATLAVARTNAKNLGLPTRVKIKKSDLLAQVKGSFDVITANLPYLSHEVYRDAVKRFPEIKYEPEGALYAPKKGLLYIEQLLTQAPAHLKQGGAIFLEIGAEQGEAVKALAQAHFPTAAITVLKDGCGLDRIVTVQT